MHSVKLTVLIEDADDVDMEVRVLTPVANDAASSTVSPFPLHVVATRRDDAVQDEYVLGGYAGI